MSYASPEQRQAIISGLRELARFLEENPRVPAPKYTAMHVFPDHTTPDTEQRSEIDIIAALIGSGTEYSNPGRHYSASREFGPVEYRAIAIPSAALKEQP